MKTINFFNLFHFPYKLAKDKILPVNHIEKLMMTRFTRLLVIVVAFLLACSIHPDPRFTRSDAPRKENKDKRKQTEKPTTELERENSRQGLYGQEDLRTRFALEVQRFMGAPYVWGGASPAGTDCSGLIRTVFRRAVGLDLPHSTQKLYEYGYPVTKEELRLGDLVFFREPHSSKISHVGIYLDQGKFVHASLSAGVTISDLYNSWYSKIYLVAHRVLDDSLFE